MDIQSGEDVFLFLLLFFQSPGIIDAYGLTINGYLYFVTALKRKWLFICQQTGMYVGPDKAVHFDTFYRHLR